MWGGGEAFVTSFFADFFFFFYELFKVSSFGADGVFIRSIFVPAFLGLGEGEGASFSPIIFDLTEFPLEG